MRKYFCAQCNPDMMSTLSSHLSLEPSQAHGLKEDQPIIHAAKAEPHNLGLCRSYLSKQLLSTESSLDRADLLIPVYSFVQPGISDEPASYYMGGGVFRQLKG
jgi:hypothetical protein